MVGFTVIYSNSNRGEFYTISSRTALELESYLSGKFESFVDCSICNNFIYTKPKTCPTDECDARVHSYCKDKIVVGNIIKCPLCKVEWGRSNPSSDRQVVVPRSQLAGQLDLADSEPSEDEEPVVMKKRRRQ